MAWYDALNPFVAVQTGIDFIEGDYSPKKKTPAVKTKKVTLASGEVIDVPETFDTSLYEQERALQEEVSKGLEEQVRAAREVEPGIRQAGEAALMSARQRAASQLASFRGMGEGGRGAALGRGAAATASIAEAGIRGETEMAAREARGAAAAAKTEADLAKKAILDAQKAEGTEAAQAEADAQAIVEQNTGTVYTDSDDIKKMRRSLAAKRDAATNPKVKAAYQHYINKIDNKTLETGAADVWK